MLPTPCTKCNKKGTLGCTIPNVASSLTYSMGNAESGVIGVNFFEQDSIADDENGVKTMYMVPVRTDFTEPVAVYKEKLSPAANGEVISQTISTPDNKYSMEIKNVEYHNTPGGDRGSIAVNAIISCNNLKMRYKATLKSVWEFEEMLEE